MAVVSLLSLELFVVEIGAEIVRPPDGKELRSRHHSRHLGRIVLVIWRRTVVVGKVVEQLVCVNVLLFGVVY